MSFEKISNFKIGSDPEFFLINKNTGKYISSIGIIGGSKESPKPISNDGYFIQEDNVAVEGNIPPTDNKEDFINSINFLKDYINRNTDNEIEVNNSASAIFDDDQLDNPVAQLFGCEPSYNCWTLDMNTINREGVNPNLRSTGFHIHVSFEEPTIDRRVRLLKCMDIALGVPSILYDNDNRRRSIYGKSGDSRFPEYGVEYRTLSSVGSSNNALIGLIWDNTIKAIDLFNDENFDPNKYSNVQTIINNDLKDEALKICQELKLNYIVVSRNKEKQTILNG